MRILIMGSDNFAKPLRRLGHQVSVAAPQADADLPVRAEDPEWSEVLIQAHAKGHDFDVVLVTDHVGRRTLPTGLWGAEALTIFYGLDAPLNRFWQTPYARLFDLAFLDQPREAADLARLHGGAGWLPVGVDTELYQGLVPSTQAREVAFVGVIDQGLRPKRSAILSKVARIAPLRARGGRQGQWFPTQQAAELYRACQVSLNENLFPGVTTRPLEVMAAGGCLLSESAPGAMDLLFKDGEHLTFFSPDNLQHKLEYILGDATARRRLAQAGREEVLAKHGLQQRAAEIVCRAEQMLSQGQAMRPRARPGEALGLEGEALLWAGLRWPSQAGARRLLRAAGRLQAASRNGGDRLAASRGAGCALLALGRHDEALASLAQAAQSGQASDALAWGLAAWQAGQPILARQALAQAGDLPAQPGQAAFHLAAAALLRQAGQEFSGGFNRQKLAPALWSSLEHLLEAVALQPGLASAWADLGDLLLAQGAPNHAHDCLGRALALAGDPTLSAKQAQAAREGYLA